MATPERLFWPFWPRPPVLPLPEPMPRPTRIRPLRAPSLSRRSFSFIICTRFRFVRAGFRGARPVMAATPRSLDHFDQMRDFGDRASHLRSVLALDHLVHLAEAQTGEDLPLAFRATDRRTDLPDLNGFLVSHRNYSAIAAASASASASLAPPRPSRSAIFLPRRCATDFGEVWSVSAAKVARIML